MHEWGKLQRRRDRISSRLPTEHRVQYGAWSCDPEIMTWGEIMNQMFNSLSYPGTPRLFFQIRSSVDSPNISKSILWFHSHTFILQVPIYTIECQPQRTVKSLSGTLSWEMGLHQANCGRLLACTSNLSGNFHLGFAVCQPGLDSYR